MTGLGRLGAGAGVGAAVIAVVGIAGAVAVSPSFAPTGNALSDLGTSTAAVATPTTVRLFNGGLVASGVVGVPFAAVLWRGLHVLERVAVVPYGVALGGMVLVGLFPAPQPPHTPAAITLYAASIVAMALYGIGNAASGATGRGLGTVALSGVHVGVWGWWASGGAVTRGGVAVPETLGALIFGGWVLWTAHWYLRGSRRQC